MSILIISGIEGVRNCAEAFPKQLEMKVEVAEGRRAALAALRQKEFPAVVVDESLAECDPAGADAIWERSGLAIPLQINFAVSGAARIIREIRAALHRREREQAVAMRAASASIEMRLEEHRLRAAAAFATGSLAGRCSCCGCRKTAHGCRSCRNASPAAFSSATAGRCICSICPSLNKDQAIHTRVIAAGLGARLSGSISPPERQRCQDGGPACRCRSRALLW